MEVLEQLESNDKEVVEKAKTEILKQFKAVNESWLLNGIYEYFLNTNSVRIMEVLVDVKEPHHTYLFDRLCESIKTSKSEIKVQALTLLGHVAKSQPTWLYKLPEHNLLRDILKLLKNEVEPLPLISALLVLIILLPMLPSKMGGYLNEVFEIFSRLASWNPNLKSIVKDEIIHLQVALYALFLRLYGMYPCNFLGYLQCKYKEDNPIFDHTIKPMLEQVKMNPSLVTASKDNEIAMERWKKMGVHDIIVECERFSLDLTDRCPHDCQTTSGYRSRSGTTNSSIEHSYHLPSLIQVKTDQDNSNFFTPGGFFQAESAPIPLVQNVSQSCFISQEGTSPPEAAIEATPETTPIRDLRSISKAAIQPNPNTVRALGSFRSGGSKSTTPINSQPSSPMRKEGGFVFGADRKVSQKVKRLVLERGEGDVKGVKVPTSPLRITDSRGIGGYKKEEEDEGFNMGRKEEFHELEDSDGVNEEQEHGSPCTEGGLHMPNSKSMNSFAKSMRRFRYFSQCLPETEKTETSTGSSPGNCVQYPSNTVRRANSCPEMKKSPVGSAKDSINALDEEDEEEKISSNGLSSKKAEVFSCATQTENFWPMPYEHLFLGIFPSLEGDVVKASPAQSPAPLNISQDRYLSSSSYYEILDKYIESAVGGGERDEQLQLQLLHQQLLFERYRRETHAYRNRRLLSDAKSTRLLEEYNSALRDQVQVKQREIETLKSKLEKMRKESSDKERSLQDSIRLWDEQCKSIQEEYKVLVDKYSEMEAEYKSLKEKFRAVDLKRQEADSQLYDAIVEVNIAKEQIKAGDKRKLELEEVNRELLLLGELQIKYQENLNGKLSFARRYDHEIMMLKEACSSDVRSLNLKLESNMLQLEAFRKQVGELESSLAQKDDVIASQKRILSGINEEQHEKLKALESKYQTQLNINRALEEKILELRQRHSPDTSSCHEVNVTTTDRTAGLSAHSSPLSASLASSEGSAAFHDVREVKNLQAILDQKEKGKEEESPTEPDPQHD